MTEQELLQRKVTVLADMLARAVLTDDPAMKPIARLTRDLCRELLPLTDALPMSGLAS